jgi:hypothetical protein
MWSFIKKFLKITFGSNFLISMVFLNIVLGKLNQIFFNLPFGFTYLVSAVICIFFSSKIMLFVNIFKETGFFNWFLSKFLLCKDYFYGTIFEYITFIKNESYKSALIFFAGFLISSWLLNFLFFILNNSFSLSIFISFFVLFINIFNLIENKIIFSEDNLSSYKNINLTYGIIQNQLKIKNKKYYGSNSLYYLQKRHINVKEFSTFLKSHATAILSSITVGTFFTGVVQVSTATVSHGELALKKQQEERQATRQASNDLFSRQQSEKNTAFKEFEYNTNLIKWAKEMHLKNITEKHKELKEIDDLIRQYKFEMNTSFFWNKPNHENLIKDLLKKRGEILKDFGDGSFNDNSLLEEVIKKNKEICKNTNSSKKDNSLLLDFDD